MELARNGTLSGDLSNEYAAVETEKDGVASRLQEIQESCKCLTQLQFWGFDAFGSLFGDRHALRRLAVRLGDCRCLLQIEMGTSLCALASLHRPWVFVDRNNIFTSVIKLVNLIFSQELGLFFMHSMHSMVC